MRLSSLIVIFFRSPLPVKIKVKIVSDSFNKNEIVLAFSVFKLENVL